MTEIHRPSIVGPLQRRSWMDIVSLRRLASSIDHAIVIEANEPRIIHAHSGRVLSDFLTRPYSFREIDPRAQTFSIATQAESFEAKFTFTVAIGVTYRVANMARVSASGPEIESQLEQAIIQSIAQISHSFGVEQAHELEENIREALLQGDVIRVRMHELGLQMLDTDVRASLSSEGRAWAEQLREHMRERAIVDQFQVPSRDNGQIFDVHFNGTYTLQSRLNSERTQEATEAVVCEALIKVLLQVGRTFGITEQREAAQAMNQALRTTSSLQQALASVDATLTRTSVRVQSQRALAAAEAPSRAAIPAPPAIATPPTPAKSSAPAVTPEPTPPSVVADDDDAPAWLKLRARIEESEERR